MKLETKHDRGVAGLTILLSLIVMLFVIGLLVMIFALMSGSLQDTDTLFTRTASAGVTAEAVTQGGLALAGGDPLTVATLNSPLCVITSVTNGTAGGTVISAGNYTEIVECAIANTTSTFSTSNWLVNYTYTFLADTTGATTVINDTGNALVGVTDWFDIFIVIGAMVVLILLVVIIITAIRSSGMVADGSA